MVQANGSFSISTDASRAPKPGEAEAAGTDFATGVRYARSQVRDNRPVLDGESGPIDHWIEDEKFDDEVFHDMSWAHLMAGGAGPGTRWPYRNPHHVTTGMLETLRAMRTFCDGVDWRAMTGAARSVKINGPPESRASVFGAGESWIAWLRLAPATHERRFVLSAGHRNSAGDHVRAFDIRNGRWIAPSVEARGDEVQVDVPPEVDELALVSTLGPAGESRF